jgi:hypothetical protein
MSACRVPCRSCPWRVDQDASDIPNFDLELAERLRDTCSGEFGAAMFACHQSREGAEVVCAGWLARYGRDNIAVRLQVMVGKIAPEALEPGDDWPETHETFDEVIEKLRATA